MLEFLSCRRIFSVKFVLAALVVPLSHFVAASTSSNDRVLLSNVNTLTLYGDKKTAWRRTKAYPQLACVGGDAAKYGYQVDVMQCKNMGGEYDREDVQWSCTAELPEEFKLGRTEVVCEGYSSPDDAYVLKGSCGVEYTLQLTSKGRDRYVYGKQRQHRHTTSQRPPTEASFSSLGTLFRWIKHLVIGVFSLCKRITFGFFNLLIDYPLVFFITTLACYKLYQWTIAPIMRWFTRTTRAGQPLHPRRPFWSGFFGGGGGGGTNNPPGPPPPYSYYPPSSYRKTYHVPPETQIPRPGFWTGFASGGATGYGLGRSSATRTAEQSWYGTQAEPSGWSMFSGGNGYYSDRDRDRDNSGPEIHTSTGFGGTSRR